MRIERRYTTDGQSPYADIAFRVTTSEIRNPDGSVVFRADDVEVPAAWSQVASDVLCAEIFPQGRRAGAPQEGRGDDGSAVAVALGGRRGRAEGTARKGALRRRAFGQAGVRPACRHLDLLGLERGGYFDSEADARAFFRRAPLHAGDADGGTELAAVVQTPACTGPTASTARARATSTWIFGPAN